MDCSNTRAIEENKHELSSGTIYRSPRVGNNKKVRLIGAYSVDKEASIDYDMIRT